MLHALIVLGLFTAKTIIIFLFFLAIFITFFALAAKSKDKSKSRLLIKNLNKKYAETTETILEETLPKKAFKHYLKEKNAAEKAQEKSPPKNKNVYVLNFVGDIKASAVSTLSDEITAILNVATPADEVVLRIESPGGVVHGYGLAAAQLMRLRAKNIPLTICVDKIAASGGYWMACVGNKILAAPYAIVGSIGVIVQLPNFNRLLKDKHIDFEQLSAGEFKRTISLFGENTEEGKEKLQEELEDIHTFFKDLISKYRKDVDINKVATGEHWLALQALELKLVDGIQTSDDYLLETSKNAQVFEISHVVKKPLLSRLTASANMVRERLFGSSLGF